MSIIWLPGRQNDRLDALALCQRLDRFTGEWARFTNRWQVSSYTGLCPGEHSGGGKRRGQAAKRQHQQERQLATVCGAGWGGRMLNEGGSAFCALVLTDDVGKPERMAPSVRKRLKLVGRQHNCCQSQELGLVQLLATTLDHPLGEAKLYIAKEICHSI